MLLANIYQQSFLEKSIKLQYDYLKFYVLNVRKKYLQLYCSRSAIECTPYLFLFLWTSRHSPGSLGPSRCVFYISMTTWRTIAEVAASSFCWEQILWGGGMVISLGMRICFDTFEDYGAQRLLICLLIFVDNPLHSDK